ncbi:MAG: hypothetical protein WD038_08965 [Balneolales bacterium]
MNTLNLNVNVTLNAVERNETKSKCRIVADTHSPAEVEGLPDPTLQGNLSLVTCFTTELAVTY